MNIEELIQKIEVEFDDLTPGILKPESRFKEILNWNSINAAVLYILIEYEYGAAITPEDFKNISTITELAERIDSKRKN